MSQEKQVHTLNGWVMLGVEIVIFLAGPPCCGCSSARPSRRRHDEAPAELLAAGRRHPGHGVRRLLVLRPLHVAAERGPGADPLRRLPRHGPPERLALDQSAEHQEAASRSARGTSTASSSRSTTSAATRSRSRPSSSGGCKTRPRPCFDVENYENYVHIQSESAVRHLASSYRLRPRRGARADAPQQRGRGVRGLAEGASGAGGQGGRGRSRKPG